MISDSIPLALIPLPAEVERRAGEFMLTPETVIVADEANRASAVSLRELLAPPTGFPLPIRPDAPAGASAIRLNARDSAGAEGYALSVSPDDIAIAAPAPNGVSHGIQTLRQLLPAEIERRAPAPGIPWRVPCVAIRDAPRFPWRGFMLDEARHFHGKQEVLRLLDLMALYKLNIFHWHLTDDQGWRIEIARYPRLTGIGSRRSGTAHNILGRPDRVPHAGFYTQEDIREIVAYAGQRHITVVPEIEMPGHSLAALAAYPELSCTGGPFEVACRFGIMRDILCAGKEHTFTFLQDVLDEVMALFPSRFIHIGGDEAPKARWRKCPDCQRRIHDEGLADEQALQGYLTDRIAAHLAARGRRIVGWNEMLHDRLAAGAVVQYWLGDPTAVVEAIRGGRDVVVSAYLSAYLDHGYSLTPLSSAYRFEPVFPELGAADEGHVLGIEAPLWTEWVPRRARLDYQAFPRLAAYAETGWSPRAVKDLGDFRRRLAASLPRLDALGVGYAPLRDVEPRWLSRKLGTLTLLLPQTRTAGRSS